MTKWGRHHAAVGAFLVGVGVACGGASHPSVAARRAREAQPVTTTPSATPSTTAPRPARPPRPSASRAPVLVSRGADPVTIARSLLLWGRWLEAEHPDPALVDRAYAWGSTLERGIRRDVAALRRTGRRIIEIDSAPLEFVVVSHLANVVSFRLTEHLARRELVDADGRVLDRAAPGVEHYLVLMIRFSADGPWRVNVVETQRPRVEVQL